MILAQFTWLRGAPEGWTPASLSVTPLLWLESTGISGSHGDAIGTWENLGSGADATSSSTARPTIDTSTFGTKVVAYDGVNDEMILPTVSMASAYTCYVLLRRYSGSDFMCGVVSKFTSYSPIQFTDGFTYAGDDAGLYRTTNPTLGWNLCQSQGNGVAALTFRIDTVSQSMTYVFTGGGTIENRLGANASGGGSGLYGKGYLAFVLFCAAQHTPTERGLVEAYVKRKFPSLVQY